MCIEDMQIYVGTSSESDTITDLSWESQEGRP